MANSSSTRPHGETIPAGGLTLPAWLIVGRAVATVRGIGRGAAVFDVDLLVCAGRCPDRGRRCAMLLPRESIAHVHLGSIPEMLDCLG
jgi:hypothetical protein